MPLLPPDCPCESGSKYGACCLPLHAGSKKAATPEELMRSRFSAFAVGHGEYLVKTLSADHPDRAAPEKALVKELSAAYQKQRFLGLRILHTSVEGEIGEVLFFARIFEKGNDRSFAELSTFFLENGEWRYAAGELVPKAKLPKDLDTLTRDAFLAIARS